MKDNNLTKMKPCDYVRLGARVFVNMPFNQSYWGTVNQVVGSKGRRRVFVKSEQDGGITRHPYYDIYFSPEYRDELLEVKK